MIESGMFLFSIQLVRFVVTVVETNAADYTFQIIVPIHEILTVIIILVVSTPYLFTDIMLDTRAYITPTIILVRASMGLSFHDETSLTSETPEPLHFRPAHSTEGSISQENRIDDIGN